MGDSDERTLYVGNLHASVTDEILYELFLQAGPIEKITRPKDRDTGNLKNFGFILFSHEKTVPYAIHLTNGIKLFGYPLKCQARGNGMLPHFSEVGIHSIEDSERSMSDYKNDSHNDSAYYSQSKRNHRRDDRSFKPKPLDPKQTWRNTIDYQEDQMKQSMLGCSFDSMSPNPSGYRHRSFNSASSNSPNFDGGSSSTPARSASHYHNLSKRISSELSSERGSSDLRSRLGKSSSHNPSGNSYRSQRESSNYGRQESYNQSQSYNNYNQSQSYNNYNQSQSYNNYNQSQSYNNYNQSQSYGNYNQSHDNYSQSSRGQYNRHSSYDNSGGGNSSRKDGSHYNRSHSYDRNQNKRNNRYYQ